MSECNLILSSILPDSTTITSIRACINYCANPTINPTASYQAGITAISRTDPSPACYCFQVDRVILFGQDPSYCTPCPDDSSYRCGGFVGPVPPRTTDMKSIVLYSAIFQPFPVNDPPPPSPPPPSPPPPSPAPIVSSPVSVEPGFTTENVITPSATDSTLPDAIAPLATTTIITGTDGSVTARTLNPHRHQPYFSPSPSPTLPSLRPPHHNP
ncbi:hypothetical protein BC829DRAFT_446193 [Chytridium lagenaria]|nr:hypothetical protein BC829DRAFT_446193 [Chytridium lagenaria]